MGGAHGWGRCQQRIDAGAVRCAGRWMTCSHYPHCWAPLPASAILYIPNSNCCGASMLPSAIPIALLPPETVDTAIQAASHVCIAREGEGGEAQGNCPHSRTHRPLVPEQQSCLSWLVGYAAVHTCDTTPPCPLQPQSHARTHAIHSPQPPAPGSYTCSPPAHGRAAGSGRWRRRAASRAQTRRSTGG